MTYHGAHPSRFKGETMRLNICLNRRASMTILCLTVLGLSARRADAQFQYTPPGGPDVRPESRREQLKRELDAARYHLGPVRVAPWATLRDLAYVQSLAGSGLRQPNDFTATAGAGFRAYLRNGPKATWTAQVLPEYVFWLRQTERRQLNGRYLLGFYGYFNRLTVEVRAGREQQQQLVTPEVPTPVSSRRDGGEVLTELRITGSVSTFAALSYNRQNNLVDTLLDPATSRLRLLDRDESIVRAGVRWRPDRLWTVGLGAEHSEVNFAHSALDRSNTGTAPVAEMRFEGHRVTFQLDAADRSLTATRGAEFVPFHKLTGSAALGLGSAARVGTTLYVSRNLVYSLSPDYAYFEDERVGVALNAGFGQRTTGRVFVEGGHETYTPFAAGTPDRTENVTSVGASLTVALRQGLTLGVQGLRSRFDSNLPGGDRTYSSVGLTVNLVGFQ
jgi:hypothetical protein